MFEDSFNFSSCSFGASNDFKFTDTLGLTNTEKTVSNKNKILNPVINPDPVIIQKVHSSKFGEFKRFYICITKGENFKGCSMSSLFLKIRIHPLIPIIETPTVWCVESDLEFRCGYSLDFNNFLNIDLQSVQPTIELHKRINKKTELLGLSIIPLNVFKKVECYGFPLTFLYHNSNIEIKSFLNNEICGNLLLTIALGFPEHQKIFDPNTNYDFFVPNSEKDEEDKKINNKELKDNSLIRKSIKNIKNSKNIKKKIIIEEEDIEEEEEELITRRKKKKSNNKKNIPKKSQKNIKKETDLFYGLPLQLADLAVRSGFKPPNYSDFDWKSKAKKKGWRPPEDKIFSSIGINCTFEDLEIYKEINIQTEDQLISIQNSIKSIIKNEEIQNNEYEEEEEEKFEDDKVNNLLKLLNNKNNQNHIIEDVFLSNSSSQIDTSISENPNHSIQLNNKRVFNITPSLVLFEKKEDYYFDFNTESNSSDILNLSNDIKELINSKYENKEQNSILKSKIDEKINSLIGASDSDIENQIKESFIDLNYSDYLYNEEEEEEIDEKENLNLQKEEKIEEFSFQSIPSIYTNSSIQYIPEIQEEEELLYEYSDDIESETNAILKKIDPKLIKLYNN